MTGTEVRVSPAWLRLREDEDAAARSRELARAVRAWPGPGEVRVVHDLGAGDGSMGRWLGPLLGGPQHWVLHDRDPDLLHAAAGAPPVPSPGGPRTAVETRVGDITRLTSADLRGASLVTASALLDVLTLEEVGRLVRLWADVGAPVLVALSVTGRVQLHPTDVLDGLLTSAFNDHQRRATARGALLGPEAVRVTVALLHQLGWRVRLRPSPWRLDGRRPALTEEWLHGWVGAAVEQRPELGPAAEAYVEARTAQLAAGALRVGVHHLDLLALPGGGPR
ncbi:MAG TPA: SAM-dependent methyltransferase [Phycicoccus sp.]